MFLEVQVFLFFFKNARKLKKLKTVVISTLFEEHGILAKKLIAYECVEYNTKQKSYILLVYDSNS